MDQLNKINFTAIDRYFTHLSLFGYMNDVRVGLLLLLTFLNKLLNRCDLTEKEYNLIQSKINCIETNSCLAPYQSYIVPRLAPTIIRRYPCKELLS